MFLSGIDLLELILPLPDQILKIRAGSSRTSPRATPAATVILRWHWKVFRVLPPLLKRRMRVAGGTPPVAMTYPESDSVRSLLGGV